MSYLEILSLIIYGLGCHFVFNNEYDKEKQKIDSDSNNGMSSAMFTAFCWPIIFFIAIIIESVKFVFRK